MIPRDEATRILMEVSAIEVATSTWEAGVDDEGRATNAGSVLNLETGRVVTFAWGARKDIPASRCIVLYTVSAARRAGAAQEAACAAMVPPSAGWCRSRRCTTLVLGGAGGRWRHGSTGLIDATTRRRDDDYAGCCALDSFSPGLSGYREAHVASG